MILCERPFSHNLRFLFRGSGRCRMCSHLLVGRSPWSRTDRPSSLPADSSLGCSSHVSWDHAPCPLWGRMWLKWSILVVWIRPVVEGSFGCRRRDDCRWPLWRGIRPWCLNSCIGPTSWIPTGGPWLGRSTPCTRRFGPRPGIAILGSWNWSSPKVQRSFFFFEFLRKEYYFLRYWSMR